ncbi:heterokaryon incompatibility protein-domain-containing protein [Ilyonectria robusta]|uniref:heterokaryon incompatibility protein-domain-containing protein n=1 Tax=Ilyonectria robusta TaxID=1079257 RepID=UPI001E8EB696|nr:heterokaryon incompatibility protein-domain-containing protein [Ilyonectria robusta]KAH8736879.1 heterokaryon incompatibility protein-domain-containing protein [Ilyonectria robusta]
MTPLNLDSLPFPLGKTDEDARRDPILCTTCFNIHPSSARTAVLSPQIRMHERSNWDGAIRAAQLIDGVKETDRLVLEATLPKLVSWNVEINVVDMSRSSSGCATCYLLKEALRKVYNGVLNLDDSSLFLDVVFCEKIALRIGVKREPEDEESEILLLWEHRTLEPVAGLETFELYTLPGSPSPWPTVGCLMNQEFPRSFLAPWLGGLAGHVSSDPGSDNCFSTIKKWIRDCKRNHPVCAEADKAMATPFYPKRIISIGPDLNKEIHLLESNNQIQGPYIALGHYWGKSGRLASTKATTEPQSSRVSYDGLPQIFQDAIEISRKLSIHYIWIDALCIVEDGEIDWEIQTAEIASIYSHAEMVIAATGSVGDDGGCLFQRKQFATIAGTYPTGKPFEIYARQSNSHDQFKWGPYDIDDFTGSSKVPHDTHYPRSWCFQEKLLSTRILHFTKDEVIFDCLAGIDCECGVLFQYEDNPLLPHRRILKTGHKHVAGRTSYRPSEDSEFYKGVTFNEDDDEFANHHERWRDLIVQYSMDIENELDRLPAIGGLASRWADGQTGRYFAGLWETDLLNHLRWYPEKDETNETQNIDSELGYIAPNLSPFGAVTSGHIFLTGTILKKDGHDKTVAFRRPDNGSILRKLESGDFFCLRYCTKTWTQNAYDDDCALVLKEVQESDFVYKRVGFILNYPSKAWDHNRDSVMVNMYIV